MKLRVKCPRCGVEEILDIQREDITSHDSGIIRLGYLHSDHILIIDLDGNYFIRGAYISSLKSMIFGVKLFFREYKILINPPMNHEIELIITHHGKKIIDARAFIKSVTHLPRIMSEMFRLMERIPKGLWYRGEIRVSDKTYDIAFCNDITIILGTRMKHWPKRTQILRAICNRVQTIPLTEDKLKELLDMIKQEASKWY